MHAVTHKGPRLLLSLLQAHLENHGFRAQSAHLADKVQAPCPEERFPTSLKLCSEAVMESNRKKCWMSQCDSLLRVFLKIYEQPVLCAFASLCVCVCHLLLCI